MTRKTSKTLIVGTRGPVECIITGHLAKPSALRHAKRIDRDAKHARDRKPEFDPRDTDRWIDRHGRFTIPPSKEKPKVSWFDAYGTARMSGCTEREATKVANEYTKEK